METRSKRRSEHGMQRNAQNRVYQAESSKRRRGESDREEDSSDRGGQIKGEDVKTGRWRGRKKATEIEGDIQQSFYVSIREAAINF